MELGDKIKEIAENESLRTGLIDKGLERAKQFHPKKYSEKLISLYSEVINQQ